jgi:hypothetical protein
MLNDIKPPPPDPDVPPAREGRGRRSAVYVDVSTVGRHHPRVAGEPTKTDLPYDMPMEDRGSGFNIVLSLIVLVLTVVLLTLVWMMLR